MRIEFKLFIRKVIFSRELNFCLQILIYSYFEKGCLTNVEKLTRQCRKLLWVMVIFTVVWMNHKVFQCGGNKQHKHAYSFFLVPCCWITMNLNQAKPNSYYTWCQSTLSRTLLYFCGTTFVETAVYIKNATLRVPSFSYNFTTQARNLWFLWVSIANELKTIATAITFQNNDGES